MNPKTTKLNNWLIYEPNNEQMGALARDLHINPAVASVYLARGLDSALEFHCFSSEGFEYPAFLLPEMGRAADLVVRAIENHESILIHGDADADGICSTALLTHGLQALGGYNIISHVPSRLTDGFGLSVESVQRAAKAEVKMIITVDCGVEAFDAAILASDLHIDLIITDHHMPKACGVPICSACVNPKRSDSIYPNSDLAGVGVAYKLLQSVAEGYGYSKNYMDEIALPLVALGTVADCVSVVGENRTLIKQGLELMGQTKMVGLKELIKLSGVKSLDTEAIGFFIAPMINASCRLGCPEYALRLLLESEPVLARMYAHRLKELNDERKSMQKQLEDEVLSGLPDNIDQYPAIFATGENWHPGLVGLVATRLATQFGKPSFVGANFPNEDSVRGSCRSVPGISVIAALESCSDILIKYGGHSMAAGFEVHKSNLERLECKLYDYFDGLDTVVDNSIYIDAEMPLAALNHKTFEAIEKLAPFGQGNLRPVLATSGVTIAAATTFGRDNAHLKLILTNDHNLKTIVPAIYWGHGSVAAEFQARATVDIAYNLTLDNYQAKPSVVLTVEDCRLE